MCERLHVSVVAYPTFVVDVSGLLAGYWKKRCSIYSTRLYIARARTRQTASTAAASR